MQVSQVHAPIHAKVRRFSGEETTPRALGKGSRAGDASDEAMQRGGRTVGLENRPGIAYEHDFRSSRLTWTDGVG
jgi:hypothetical protein